MASPLILARTFKDAHAYAQGELGLSVGYYRVVTSAGTIKAVRNVDIHLVPGWNKRPDRFTMQSALKWCRLNILDVEKLRESAAAFDAATTSTSPPEITPERAQEILDGPKPSEMLELPSAVDLSDFFADTTTEDAPEPVATCTTCGLTPHDPECTEVAEPVSNVLETEIEVIAGPTANIPTVVSDEAKELEAKAPKARRRTRCKECEQLHFKGDPCVDSEAV